MKKEVNGFFLRLLGWKIKGRIPPEEEVPKLLIVVGPHSSFVDFPIGLFTRNQQGRLVYYLGKKSLFKPPFGLFLRWLGGYPVDRSGNLGLVDSIAAMFDAREKFSICITPEATRKRVNHLKSGFYHISKKANIPIQLAGMDFGSKTFYFSEVYYPGDSFEEEQEKIRKFWGRLKAFHPEKGFQ